jgi:hypothetical protein
MEFVEMSGGTTTSLVEPPFSSGARRDTEESLGQSLCLRCAYYI